MNVCVGQWYVCACAVDIFRICMIERIDNERMDKNVHTILFSSRSGLNVNIILNIPTICYHKVFELYSALSVDACPILTG